MNLRPGCAWRVLVACLDSLPIGLSLKSYSAPISSPEIFGVLEVPGEETGITPPRLIDVSDVVLGVLWGGEDEACLGEGTVHGSRDFATARDWHIAAPDDATKSINVHHLAGDLPSGNVLVQRPCYRCSAAELDVFGCPAALRSLGRVDAVQPDTLPVDVDGVAINHGRLTRDDIAEASCFGGRRKSGYGKGREEESCVNGFHCLFAVLEGSGYGFGEGPVAAKNRLSHPRHLWWGLPRTGSTIQLTRADSERSN